MTDTRIPDSAPAAADLSRPPVPVVAGVVVAGVVAVAGAVACLIALAVAFGDFPSGADNPLPYLLGGMIGRLLPLLLAATAAAALAILTLRGVSTARLGLLAVFGAAFTTAAATALGLLATVVYGVSDPYAEEWQDRLLQMWLYLIPALLFLAPLLLLNLRGSARWFRDRQAERFPAAATAAPPSAPGFARLALVLFGVLLLLAEVWAIQSLMRTELGPRSDLTLGLVQHFAATLVPLLLVIVAVTELRAASGLGQFAALAAAGYACYRGLGSIQGESVGLWYDGLDGLDFAPLLTAAAMTGVGVLTLVLLLQPTSVRYLDLHRFRTDPVALFAEIDAEALDEADFDEHDETEPDGAEAPAAER